MASDVLEVKWDKFKTIVDQRKSTIQWVDLVDLYYLQIIDETFKAICRVPKTNPINDDQEDFETNYKTSDGQVLTPRTANGLPTFTSNRIPFGFTIYPTGVSDDTTTGSYGTGADLFLDKDTKSVDFKILNNWFAIGGEASWSDQSKNRDYVTASLIAPATEGVQGTGFNYTKVPTGLGFNLYVPTAVGIGDWDLDLTSTKFSGKEYLNVTPVPVEGNTGFFDYNKTTNILTANLNQTGGYNLYDIDLNLFSFGRKLWGAKGGIRSFKETDVVGKLLYANWKVKFELFIYDEANRVNDDVSVGLTMVTAVKKNL